MRKLAIVLVPLLILTVVVSVVGCDTPYREQTVNISAMSTKSITIYCDSGDRIQGSFTVLENDIRFYIKDPSRKIVYNAERVESNAFNVYCDSTGYYTLFFDNDYSIITSKTVYLRLRKA